MLYFITGSKNKFEEAKAVLGDAVEQLEIDLMEIQEMDPHVIIQAKLQEALKHKEGEFIVEDISLYIDGLNGLPGPLIKWFMKTIGNEGLVAMAERFGSAASVKAIIGYANTNGDVSFFEGELKGTIVPAQGENGFGFDPIFKPEGHEKTFAEMGADEKNELSMRRLALEKLKTVLN